MSSLDDHKRLVAHFFERFSAGDIDGVSALFTDDMVWRLPGHPDEMALAGERSKPQIDRLFRRMLGELRSGLQMTPLSLVAEGDKVAVEALSSGDRHDGRRYRQQYHFLFQLRGDRICRVHEYLDTLHVHAVWVAPAPADASPPQPA